MKREILTLRSNFRYYVQELRWRVLLTMGWRVVMTEQEESSDDLEEVLTYDSEDSEQSDMVRTGKECKEDLPSLRVWRGGAVRTWWFFTR
jgi:hypothetical protein